MSCSDIDRPTPQQAKTKKAGILQKKQATCNLPHGLEIQRIPMKCVWSDFQPTTASPLPFNLCVTLDCTKIAKKLTKKLLKTVSVENHSVQMIFGFAMHELLICR